MIFRFDHPHEGNKEQVAQLVGGKGASLWAMQTLLNLPTPPGFTIGCDYSREFDQVGLTESLKRQVKQHVNEIEAVLRRGFGDPKKPLLLAVRSGAPVSMPGMMDTVLNLGVTPNTVAGLEAVSGSRQFALDTFYRFLKMYKQHVVEPVNGAVPGGSPRSDGSGVQAHDPDDCDLEKVIAHMQAEIEALLGPEALHDPYRLLHETIAAVFRSRHSDAARTYRKLEGLPESLGTSVTVQAMVFGNMGENSGTGVVFSRNPKNGVKELTGDWMNDSQGEDVVAGIGETEPVQCMRTTMPSVFSQLEDHVAALEAYYRDMVDIEFTVERGKLWILQARVGKRSPAATSRIAVELVEAGSFGVDRKEALRRVPGQLFVRAAAQQGTFDSYLTEAIGASPGVATGAIVFTSEDAVEAAEQGKDVILVRRETSPADVHGMAAAVGILTTLGGLMSHAAVVARDWALPAVVGATELDILEDGLHVGEDHIRAGEIISIDGTTGRVVRGEVDTRDSSDPYLETLRQWAEELQDAS